MTATSAPAAVGPDHAVAAYRSKPPAPPVVALTEAEYAKRAEPIALRFAVHPTPFGAALFVSSPYGLCRLVFVDEGGYERALAETRAAWPGAVFHEDEAGTRGFAQRAFADAEARRSVPLFLKGTAFDLEVWRALLAIPPGEVRSYGELARAVGRPGAHRAVGRACGRNPVGWLVPCHRVIRADGSLGGFGWGLARKRAMLAFEGARAGSPR